jgi:hypothetical protein
MWDRDELLSVVKYASHMRNKVALTVFWDLDARNHKVTLLKIKNIRLKEKYGEGELPHEAKTGSGPILLTCSFPYVRDWLDEHPVRNEPEARLTQALRLIPRRHGACSSICGEGYSVYLLRATSLIRTSAKGRSIF